MTPFLRYLRGPFLRELEPVFRVLVAWPDGAPSGPLLHGFPIGTADERRELMHNICGSWEPSKRKLPAETVQRIRAIVPDFDGTTYSAGARAVLANPTFFDRVNQERNGNHVS